MISTDGNDSQKKNSRWHQTCERNDGVSCLPLRFTYMQADEMIITHYSRHMMVINQISKSLLYALQMVIM